MYQFKGLPEVQTMVQFNSRRLADRAFSSQPPSRKAKCLSAGHGLQCIITLQS